MIFKNHIADRQGFGFDVIGTVVPFVQAMGSAEFTETSQIEITAADQEKDAPWETRVLVLRPQNLTRR